MRLRPDVTIKRIVVLLNPTKIWQRILGGQIENIKSTIHAPRLQIDQETNDSSVYILYGGGLPTSCSSPLAKATKPFALSPSKDEFSTNGLREAHGKEKFIDALEGLVIDSPVGKLELRGCDHQVLYPMYFGVTKKVPQDEFFIASDIMTVPAKDYMMSCEEIKALRK